ncbi:copper resistance protein [Helicobacter saguini]|uniref:Copper resistance protein n=1 Tax=Helicobacter saguini TaxID=1548018 RepID=A0A347VN49_9HELI|nr:FixH family protein [Helicobacter saguini]MWV61902.1 copper resistance protein [Helicobacter saguini]MWV67423.1 copper resistance protein [Helicobacter saguini]MWV69776.1 copper resistance protein [Helicobacter saguini]MWV73007.1 copper resistance protein [Helicobacter saguini]TLD95614.1 copper resistance protein [Helicobacter saguini]
MRKYFRILGVIIALQAMFCGVLFAFSKNFSNKDFSFILESSKDFTSGQNEFSFIVQKGGKSVAVENLKVTFFMPEMPGMPKMSSDSTLSANGDSYKGSVNLAHGGTWQVKVSFSFEGKKYQAKTSIDF